MVRSTGAFFRFICCLGALSCSKAPAPVSGPDYAASRERAIHARGPAQPAAVADDIGPTQAEQDEWPPGPLLTLPSDPAFLAAPLPAPVPDRYASWREVERIDVGQSHLMEVDRLPSGRLVALSRTEGKVRVYERGSKRLVAHHDAPNLQELEPSSLLAFPTAPDRYVLGSPAGLGIYDAMSGALLSQIDPKPVWKVRWSDDGRVLMALSSGPPGVDSILRFFARGDGNTMKRLDEYGGGGRIDAWALSPDARLLALVRYPGNGLRILDLQRGGEEIYAAGAPQYAGDVTFSPDGRLLAVAGDGLLVVDLANPERRAFYSYVKNNMGHVRFSPSGDAVVASSYDGKIRIFDVQRQPSGELSLQLLRELSHAGQANVYAFVFSADGSELVSASGDRTLRAFAGRKTAPASDAQRTFLDLDTWKKLMPESTEPAPVSGPNVVGGEWSLDSELVPPRPSRIVPGVYACKITAIYKLRTCYVRRDAAGYTRLEFTAENLLHLGGVLWDDGPAVRYEAKLLSESPICSACDSQPVHAVFRGQNGHYQGLLTFRDYHDPLVPLPIPPVDVRIEEANDRFPLVLEYQGPLPKSRGRRPKAEE